MSKNNAIKSKLNPFTYTGGGRKSLIKPKYYKWRNENRLPINCDNEICYFNKNELIWNNKKLGSKRGQAQLFWEKYGVIE